jgi:hypothetical protein
VKAIETYIAAWNAPSAEERQQLLSSCMTADVVYIDPHSPDSIQGIASLQALIATFRSRFDHALIPEGKLDTHHHVARLGWRLQRDNGDVLSKGLMVVDLTPDGMLKRVVHFVD